MGVYKLQRICHGQGGVRHTHTRFVDNMICKAANYHIITVIIIIKNYDCSSYTERKSSQLKPGSQYDTGAVSVTSVVSVTGKKYFFTSQIASLGLALNFSTI